MQIVDRNQYRALLLAAVLLGGCAIVLPVAGLNAADAQQRPNVLIIYTDDQGSIDAGCYGAEDLQTPNLDRLAARGVRFTQMLAPAPICSASRAGLLTGRYPVRAGVPTNGEMPAAEVTVAELLKEAGYHTCHIGKWHLGYEPPRMPNGQGFDYSFGHMVGCIDNYSHFFYWSGPNRHDLWRNGKHVWHDGEFFPDLMVEECNAFLKKQQESERPFFLYWAINVPHYPYQGTDKWREAYADLPYPRNLYAPFVSTMDEKIGEVLDQLDTLGMTEDTLVIFQSDHGHSTEERAHGGGGNSGPYRGAKACLFEGGLRVPSIVSWPRRLPRGEVRDQLATGCDWLPTILEYCGVKPPSHKLDGKSLASVIASTEAASPHRVLHWHYGRGQNPQWAVREGTWKLLGNPRDTTSPRDQKKPGVQLTGDNRLFLANLAEDIGESTNLAKEHPDVLDRLLEHRKAFLAELAAEEVAGK